MSSLHEMAECLEQSRNMPDPADRATGLEILERMTRVSAVIASMQGEGSDDCLECGVEIPKARRLAAPWATCCIECASLKERRHG